MTKTSVQTKPSILEAAFIGYPVLDIARARNFYETVLGLTCTHISEDGNWIEYDLKNTTLVIGRSEGWNPSTSGPSLALELEDYEATVATLKAQNVPFYMETLHTKVCQMCIIGDSEGNSLTLHKRK